MNDRLKALADAGVSIWLDDLSRERIETGNLATLVDESGVVGVTTNPIDLRRRPRQRREVRAADQGAQGRRRRRRRRRSSSSPPPTSSTAATSCDPSTTPPTASTVACRSRSSRASPATPTRTIEHGQEAVGQGRSAQHADQDPGHRRRACRPSPQTTAAGISVNVTLIFSLDRYRGVMNAYLDGLEQADADGQDLSNDPLRRVVLRQPRRLRGRQAPPRRQPAARQGSHRQRASRLRGVRGGLRLRPLQGARGQGCQRPASAVGVDRRQGPVPTPTRCTSPSSWSPTPSTRCPRRRSRHSPITVSCTATPSPARTTRRASVIAELEAQGISYDEVVELLETEGLEKFDASWAELLETVSNELDKA